MAALNSLNIQIVRLRIKAIICIFFLLFFSFWRLLLGSVFGIFNSILSQRKWGTGSTAQILQTGADVHVPAEKYDHPAFSFSSIS